MKIFLCLVIFCSLANNALGTSSDSRHSEYDEFDNTSSEYSISEYARKRSSFMEQFRVNTIRISAIAGTSVTLTCSIDLDDVMFSKSENYKIIWSRESVVSKDYEPLFLDDTRLVFDQRITANRFYINKITYNQLQWNLVINDLKETDNRNYICQLNRHPYDIYWLKRFMLNINGRIN